MVTTLAVVILVALVVTYVAVWVIRPALLRLELPCLKLEVRVPDDGRPGRSDDDPGAVDRP